MPTYDELRAEMRAHDAKEAAIRANVSNFAPDNISPDRPLGAPRDGAAMKAAHAELAAWEAERARIQKALDESAAKA